MNTESSRRELQDYILSGHAYLHCPSTEKTRFLAELKELAGNRRAKWAHPVN